LLLKTRGKGTLFHREVEPAAAELAKRNGSPGKTARAGNISASGLLLRWRRFAVSISQRIDKDVQQGRAMGDQQKHGDQKPQQPGQQAQPGGQERMGNKPGMGSKPGQSADKGMVGQDTDGDGKTVQPGQKPGQSHGTGHIDK
jgi:hypothetical protein